MPIAGLTGMRLPSPAPLRPEGSGAVAVLDEEAAYPAREILRAGHAVVDEVGIQELAAV